MFPLRGVRPLANGASTDHPVPDLPFVDDAHLPLDDPQALEAVGRRKGGGMWGRYDSCRDDGGWVAFTTDPVRHDLAWCVRWHPQFGRSVTLFRDQDASSVHTAFNGPALAVRSGGYWWDGSTWYRPPQVWAGAGEDYVRRPVPAATTVTAADLLAGVTGAAGEETLLDVADVDLDAPPPARWLDELARWAAGRQMPLTNSMVRISAPELAGDQLVGVTQLAEIGGVSASTVRAYLSRGEGDLPQPQAVVNGRSMWARPVAEEWVEQRRRSPENLAAVVSVGPSNLPMAPGVRSLWDRFTRSFFSSLWENPQRRRAWSLRSRNEETVRTTAEGLAWEVAASLRSIVPVSALATTVRYAVLDEFATGKNLDRQLDDDDIDDVSFYGILPDVARVLDWLVRHYPTSAADTINQIVGDAERRLSIPRDVSERSLRTALHLDGELDGDVVNQFLDLVFSPGGATSAGGDGEDGEGGTVIELLTRKR
jgi:hypothetical protein